MRPVIVAAILAAAVGASAAPPAGTVQLQAQDVKWTAGNPAMPKGTQISVLQGNPREKGIFTMRVKFPAGAVLAPHWHPLDERVTVLSGHALVGFGDAVDAARTTRIDAGGFYVNPANAHHFVIYPEEAVLQVTGEGPWELHFVK